METNPYAPSFADESMQENPELQPDELAGRFTRFASAFIDGLTMLVFIMPAMFLTGYIQRAGAGQVTLLEQVGISFFSGLVFLLVHGYFLVTRGQTLGKMATGIQIVDHETGQRLSFLRVYVFRNLWGLPILALTIAIPGQIDDNLSNLVYLVDVLMIFAVSRRCLHDYIAGSKVVLYQDRD